MYLICLFVIKLLVFPFFFTQLYRMNDQCQTDNMLSFYVVQLCFLIFGKETQFELKFMMLRASVMPFLWCKEHGTLIIFRYTKFSEAQFFWCKFSYWRYLWLKCNSGNAVQISMPVSANSNTVIAEPF